MTHSIGRLPTPNAVLFDLDGTLVDTVDRRIDAWEQALTEVGLPVGRERLSGLIGLDGRRLASEVAALHGHPIDGDRAELIDHRSGEIYEALNVAPAPLPGVGRLVAALERRGVGWAIATSSRAAQVATSVAALGLDREPMIVDASHVEHAKPEPDLLLYAARQLGVEPTSCWYIGDSTWDMVAAVAAGMLAIGVTAGSAVDAAALAGAGAAAVVQTLGEVAAGPRRLTRNGPPGRNRPAVPGSRSRRRQPVAISSARRSSAPPIGRAGRPAPEAAAGDAFIRRRRSRGDARRARARSRGPGRPAGPASASPPGDLAGRRRPRGARRRR